MTTNTDDDDRPARVARCYRLRDLATRLEDAGRIDEQHADRLRAAGFDMVADLTLDQVTAALRAHRARLADLAADRYRRAP